MNFLSYGWQEVKIIHESVNVIRYRMFNLEDNTAINIETVNKIIYYILIWRRDKISNIVLEHEGFNIKDRKIKLKKIESANQIIGLINKLYLLQ